MTTKSEWGWRDYVAFGIGVTMAIAGLVAFTWQWVAWKPIIENQGLAAWVQAVGAVLALAVAVALPWEERRKQRREAAENAVEAQRDQHRKVLQVTVEWTHMLRRGMQVTVHNNQPRIDPAEVADLRGRLRAIEDTGPMPEHLNVIVAVVRDAMANVMLVQHRFGARPAEDWLRDPLTHAQQNSEQMLEILRAFEAHHEVIPSLVSTRMRSR